MVNAVIEILIVIKKRSSLRWIACSLFYMFYKLFIYKCDYILLLQKKDFNILKQPTFKVFFVNYFQIKMVYFIKTRFSLEKVFSKMSLEKGVSSYNQGHLIFLSIHFINFMACILTNWRGQEANHPT